MDGSGFGPLKASPPVLDSDIEEQYSSQSKILQEFTNIPNIDNAWIVKSDNGNASQAMFALSQPNVLANKRRDFILSARVLNGDNNTINFEWSPFPIEMTGVSTILPSPSGSKLLVVRNSGNNESPTQFEIWSQSQLENEFLVPQSVHGSVYTDGWFERISWNSDETRIAYVAEEPSPSKPTFDSSGYKKSGSTEKDCGTWKGRGDWEEDWGETYEGKRQPALFVANINSGEVRAVEGIKKSLSVGQVVWAPPTNGLYQYLVFVGWSADTRKLGMKYCNNRPCALYATRDPFLESGVDEHPLKDNVIEELPVICLTQSISSAFFPRFSPDGKFLVFLSAASAADSGAHWGTNSLHRIDWAIDGKPSSHEKVVDVIPVVMCPEDGCFPGLYCSSFLPSPWLSDGCTMIIPSTWGSTDVILAVNILSGNVSCISPTESNYSWNVLTLDDDNIVAVSSSPISVPEIKYGCFIENSTTSVSWKWIDVSSPIKCSEKVTSLLSSLQFDIMKIPIKNVSDSLTEGAKKPFEAIFVSSNSKDIARDPLIVRLHGGPHSVSVSTFSRPFAFLSSLGYNLLIVNYRGSLGFGEEALQSLPGKVGSQDVNDVLTAIDHVVDAGLADPSKICVVGGSHGGFLTTHLIGQAPDKFAAAAAMNPVCNLASMVGITDIPDWCFFEAYGTEWKNNYTGAPSAEHLSVLHSKSPISHLSKVKTPTIFLLGAKDLRVPISNGLQYARALKEKGIEVKIMIFPQDVHELKRPQTDFECVLNIGVWFKKHCT